MNRHALVRTNEKGVPAISRCINCGKEGLTDKDFISDECENPVGRTQEESLMAVLRGPEKQ